MKCFTIADLHIFTGIPVIDDGVGIFGGLASVAGDSFRFPFPPPMLTNTIVYPLPARSTLKPIIVSVRHADVFHFTGTTAEGNEARQLPVLIAEQSHSSDALVWMLFDISGHNDFNRSTKEGTIEVYRDSSQFAPLWQILMRMQKNSSLTLFTQSATVTISWNGKDLNVLRQSN